MNTDTYSYANDYLSTIMYSYMADDGLFGPNARILLLLLENGRMLRSDFRRKYGMNYDSMKSATERLEKAGFVTYEPVGDRRESVYHDLTENGKIAAEKLVEIMSLIS